MTPFPDPGRQTAHVLVDAASVAMEEEVDPEAVSLANQRLQEIEGAIVVKVDDPGPEDELDVNVDLSNLLGPSLLTLHWLIRRLAEAEHRSEESVIGDLREYIDGGEATSL
ncbi:hypothetical protein ACPW96_20255 [Micromonospora sp. DT81.3]|uniref:hypothetical protein n=1 Tax=Micromonospora sp. DT81.3 TaxID=3416523 RepID=UPI003CEF93EE